MAISSESARRNALITCVLMVLFTSKTYPQNEVKLLSAGAAITVQGKLPLHDYSGCPSHDRFSRKGQPEIKRLSARDLKKRVVKSVLPKPSYGHGRGKVTVYALINTEGKVDCLKAVEGAPILRGAALQAVKVWAFKPVRINSKPVPIAGYITFNFLYDKVEY